MDGNFVSLVCPRVETVIYIIIDVTLLVPIRQVDNTVAICCLFYREIPLLHTRRNFGTCISKGETGVLRDYRPYNRCCLSMEDSNLNNRVIVVIVFYKIVNLRINVIIYFYLRIETFVSQFRNKYTDEFANFIETYFSTEGMIN